MTTETTTSQLPPCPLPDCKGGEHHYHNRYIHEVENSACKKSGSFHTSCYGPHQPQQQWQPIERTRIKAGMRIRATTTYRDCVTTRTGVAHHTTDDGIWYTERDRLLTGWTDPTTYEVDPATTIPADPDAELIEALREASWRIEHKGGRPDPLPGLPEARDLLTELRELGWTVIRAEEREQA